MNPIDFILNVAALMLWMRSRSIMQDRSRSRSGTLLSTLVKTGSRNPAGWIFLGGLVLLLALRAVFYWHMGSASDWIATLQMGAVVIPFRSDDASRMLLFSFLSFARMLVGFYAWLLLLSAVNRRLPDSDPLQKWVRLHLGRIDRWPAVVKLALPLLIGSGIWAALNPGFILLGLLPPPLSNLHLAQQALVIGADAYFAWESLIIVLMVIHTINSCVFLGNSSTWSFFHASAENLLKPIRWIPLRFGKLDLAPIAAIGLVLAAHVMAEPALTRLYQKPPVWP
jgi:uncharacterized protein YggT (Ycf19 family)